MLKLRHAGSTLGFLWTLLNPFLYIATYWVVFTLFIRMGMDKYPLFLIPGFLAWNFTLTALVTSSESIIQSRYLITKIAFPNEILPLTSVGIPLLDYIISMVIYIVIILIIPGISQLTSQIVLFPIIIFIQILITIGLALIVATMSVYFRDIPKLVQIGGTILFFLTPVFYPLNLIPEKYRFFVMMNPLAQVINYYQDIFYYHKLPDLYYLSGTFIFSVLIFLLGLAIFNKYKSAFAELS
jgi:homopolymeric O-antigen transport system permease protein